MAKKTVFELPDSSKLISRKIQVLNEDQNTIMIFMGQTTFLREINVFTKYIVGGTFSPNKETLTVSRNFPIPYQHTKNAAHFQY